MVELPIGLHFYWYRRKAGDEHSGCWGQLCAGMHRLTFVREELAATAALPDLGQSLERLAYHLENYLVRIYELRERAAQLIAKCGQYKEENLRLLKGRDKRKQAVDALAVKQAAKDCYLELLDYLDDDIALRNQNTHDTFLSLGYSTGHDIYDPHDALLDVQGRGGAEFERLKDAIANEMTLVIGLYDEKISRILDLTGQLLEELTPQRHRE